MLTLSFLGIAENIYANDKFHRLNAIEIRTTLIGKTVTDEYHWADKFMPDGSMSGHQLGEAQTGAWKLLNDGKLCVVRRVKTTESDCFYVWLNHDQVQFRNGGILLSEGVLKNE